MNKHDPEDLGTSSRDAALERAWREASAEQPPSDLDAAIIAAARQSVPDGGEQPNVIHARMRSRNRLTQWQPLAAAAVVAGLAFGLVQMLPREHEFAPSMRRQESAPVPAERQQDRGPQLQPRSQPQSPQPQPSRSSSARESTDTGQPPIADRAAGQRERVVVPHDASAQNTVPAPPVAPAAPAAATESAANDAVPEISGRDTAQKVEATTRDTASTAGSSAALGEISADRRQPVESAVAGRAATAAAQAPSSRAPEEHTGEAMPLDSPTWAAKVAALHASGDVAAAEHALRQFRMAVPDADSYLPDSLRSWAQTVD